MVEKIEAAGVLAAVAPGGSAVPVAVWEARRLLLHVVVVRALWRLEIVVALRAVPRPLLLEVNEPIAVQQARL